MFNKMFFSMLVCRVKFVFNHQTSRNMNINASPRQIKKSKFFGNFSKVKHQFTFNTV